MDPGRSRDGAPRGAVGGTLPLPGHPADTAVRIGEAGAQFFLRLGRQRAVQSDGAPFVQVGDLDGYPGGVVNPGVGFTGGVLTVAGSDVHLVARFGLVVQGILDLELARGRIDGEDPGIGAEQAVGDGVAVAVGGDYRVADVRTRRGVLVHIAGEGCRGETAATCWRTSPGWSSSPRGVCRPCASW